MARLKELLDILDNEDEPLPKRLKLADTAFKSSLLPIHFKDVGLLNWLMELGKCGDKEVLDKVNEWLCSEEIVNIAKSDVSQEYVFDLLKRITLILKHQDNRNFEELIVNSFLHIISNKTFQQFFKHDLEVYSKLVSQVVIHIQSSDQLLLIFKSDELFNKLYLSEEESYKTFCKFCSQLSKIIDKFSNIKKEIVAFTSKRLFQNSSKQFEKYFEIIFEQTGNENLNELSIPKIIIDIIIENYSSKNLSVISLIYHAFCSSFESKFSIIYEFTALLLQICGIDVQEKFKFLFDYKNLSYDVNFSMDVISNIYEELKDLKTNPDDKIDVFNISMTTQSLLTTIINITDPTKAVLNIFTYAIQAEPLILEPMLSTILPYVMFSDITEYVDEYNKLLLTILAVSAKLYRLSNLIAKMLQCIKHYSPKHSLETDVFAFKGTVERKKELCICDVELILPAQVLESFSKHILDLPSWQVINIFTSFVHHLKIVSESFNELYLDKLNHTYIELLSTLFCTFLSTVRITEHTTPDLVVNKFIKTMLDLKDVLQVLGNSLLDLNHNLNIMRSYLNIAFMWGEILTLLNFYSSSSEVSKLKPINNTNDYQICCISYIHPYLTADQWSSITERITNFGEKKCKTILQLLQLQNIKAIYLFENGNLDVAALFLRNLTQSPSFESLLSDRFVNTILLRNLEPNLVSLLGKHFIKEVLHDENHVFWLSGVLESPELVEKIILMVLVKIAKCCKPKKDKEQVDVKELLSTLFVSEFEEICCDSLKYHQVFKNYLKQQIWNENKLSDYFVLLKKLPILAQHPQVQLTIFLYLSSLLKCLIKEELKLKDEVEKIIVGMIQYPSDLLINLPAEYIITFILENTTDYKVVFQYWLENLLQNASNFINQFQKLVSYLLQKFGDDDKIRHCIIQVLNYLNKYKKHKLFIKLKGEINKEREQIYSTINNWQSSNNESSMDDVYFYALSLKYYLSVGCEENNKIKKDFKKYLRKISKTEEFNNEAILLLFSTILTNKKQLKGVDDQVILDIWSLTRKLKLDNNLRKEYSSLIVLIFEHISNDNFAIMCEDLKTFLKASLDNKNTNDFKEVMLNINGVFQCSLNPTKLKTWQDKVEDILIHLIDNLNEKMCDNYWEDVIAFEMNIIQANHFMITALMIDEIFRSITILFLNPPTTLPTIFKPSIQILILLLKHRAPLITDRLPPFLQKYRLLLTHLCKSGDSSLNLQAPAIEELADCAHQLEKLTNMIVACGKHVQRITPYLVADILKQYESISLYTNIKMHIDNCIYSLMSLFDQHTVSFLMRSLSTASTELFKYMHGNYKKYYKFTGKV
ncbi:uncharacterized protein [Onthophagus taurus]|uniref:uncharacterized protein n=1 Tax=Onthophagus taurus TaxID=166361 RepID=UPI0039BDFCB9